MGAPDPDLSTPQAQAWNTRLVGHSDLGGWTSASQVVVDGRYAYVAAVGEDDDHVEGVTILDVSDPRKPEVLSQIRTPPNTHSHKVQIVGDLLFVNSQRVEGYRGSDFTPGLRIYDVKDRRNPKYLTMLVTGGIGVHRFRIEPDTMLGLLPTGDEEYHGRPMWLVDFRDPLRPQIISKWGIPGSHKAAGEVSTEKPGEVFIAHGPPIRINNRIYLGYWDAGMIILDATDLRRLKMISRLDWSPPYFGHTHTVVPVPRHGIAVVTDEGYFEGHEGARLDGVRNSERSQFVWVVDIRQETNPIPIATYIPQPAAMFAKQPAVFGAHNMNEVIEDDDLAFVVWFCAGLQVVSLRDPHHPRQVGYYIPARTFGRPAVMSNDIFVDRRTGLVYFTDRWGGGLDIVEFAGER
ncbi:MAG: hypothetical protein HY660_14075 [Armatimonadetes bacterium]|nr:hypothetical protein [Armatimonadota bacterium]